MPAYYNNPYLPQTGYGQGYQYQSYSPSQPSSTPYKVMEYVDGEIGAIAYQLPPGWPANTFFPLWDVKNETIYFKSINPMGMPNPIQKARFKFETAPENSTSGSADTTQYVTKQDLEQLKEEMQQLFRSERGENR